MSGFVESDHTDEEKAHHKTDFEKIIPGNKNKMLEYRICGSLPL